MISLKTFFEIVILIYFILSDEVCTIGIVVVTEMQIKFYLNDKTNTPRDVNVRNIDATSCDPINKVIYVSIRDHPDGSLFQIKTTGKTAFNVTPIVAPQDSSVKGIAFAHENSTLYWLTNEGIYYVLVSNNDITALLTRQVLFKFNAKSPKGLAIDLKRGYVYYGNNVSRNGFATIERSGLDGFGWKVVVENMANPRGITIDVVTNTLYWINLYEDGKRSVYSIKMGVERTSHPLIPPSDCWTPFVIALFNRNVYWMEESYGELWMIPMNSSQHKWVRNINLETSPIGLFVLPDGDAKQTGKEKGEN